MTRPFNETPEDRARERAVLDACLGGERRSFVMMPRGSPFDAVGLSTWQGKVYTWPVEVKTRSCPHDQYETFILSDRKIQGLLDLPTEMGTTHASLLIVRWEDVIGKLWITEAEVSYMSDPVDGGRWDRGQPGDVEKVRHIPVTRFEIVLQRYVDQN